MLKQIVANAANARKNFFELIQVITQEDQTVIIEKKGSASVVMKKVQEPVHTKRQITKNLKLISNIGGSLHSKVPYEKNEMAIAENIFVDEYKKKYAAK